MDQDSFRAWWDGVYGANAYWVRLDGGPARSVGNTTSYAFERLDSGTDYDFEVQAGKGSLRSEWSDPFEVTTDSPPSAPAAPENVEALSCRWGR